MNAEERSPRNVKPCAASYRAEQVPGAVVIHASGFHSTSGYKVFFEQSAIDIFPPEFILWHVEPVGMVLQVLEPFDEFVAFAASDKIERVTVHDASGRHEIEVEQVPDLRLSHAGGGGR
ncbi:MAG TPA: hypothetical protein VGV38_17760 [Pyrinomonadaceae bacterium]|nr:hypothetical protein [Pyrinomonadaceae bacterium]